MIGVVSAILGALIVTAVGLETILLGLFFSTFAYDFLLTTTICLVTASALCLASFSNSIFQVDSYLALSVFFL